jgi:competence protein ComEC
MHPHEHTEKPPLARAWVTLSVLSLVTLLLWGYALLASGHGSSGGRALSVSFLDVGQGDAILIESPTGIQMLIDGGSGKSILAELSDVLPFYDRHIDILLATHADQDHVGGLPFVLERFDVDYIVTTDVTADTATYRAFEEYVQDEGAERIRALLGTHIDIGGGAVLDILFPETALEGSAPNDASVIAKLTYGDTTFLFAGDAPESVENYLARRSVEELDVDVLKVSHHGSRTSTSALFLSATTPDIAVISAGEGNQYGHPHEEVVSLLKEFGATILRTYEEGTITFVSDGASVVRD